MDIKHIAKLARIKLTEKEEEKFEKELSSVLDFINQLNKVDTSKVDPAYQITGLVNSFREDGDRKGLPSEKLVDQAPQKENGFVKVKSILKK
jgi:aspartyl-tRNA(Asn)/glutamyl-tRNA(Gln) amidotransferase subunit C